MAYSYRRSLVTSARIVVRQRFAPSIGCRDIYEDERSSVQSRSYSYGNNTSSWPLGFGGTGMSFRDPKATSGFLLARRNMTSVSTAGGVSEVDVSAADSWPPVAALQYAIDGIHTYTGLSWWSSIVVTTLVIRTLSIPIMINQLRVSSKSHKLWSGLDEIWWEVQHGGMDVAEGQERRKHLFEEHGVSGLTPLRGIFIQGSVFGSLFLAIQKMVEKVPSLQTGGFSWFIDLTTTDSFYVLPFLGVFSFCAMAESTMKEGTALKWKLLLRGVSALALPYAASVPNALLCYWIAFNFSTLVYGRIIRKPSVMKKLNIPIIQTPAQKLSSALKALDDVPPKVKDKL